MSDFNPPVMKQHPDTGAIYADAGDGATPTPLFETEQSLMEDTSLTAESLRDIYGSPIPAGVVWNQPVWSVSHLQHVNSEYLRPVLRKLRFDPDERHFADAFHWFIGEDVPLSTTERAKREADRAIHERWVAEHPWPGPETHDSNRGAV